MCICQCVYANMYMQICICKYVYANMYMPICICQYVYANVNAALWGTVAQSLDRQTLD